MHNAADLGATRIQRHSERRQERTFPPGTRQYSFADVEVVSVVKVDENGKVFVAADASAWPEVVPTENCACYGNEKNIVPNIKGLDQCWVKGMQIKLVHLHVCPSTCGLYTA